jgi:4-diphosphocytidyl-2-C-methyl-D-erythritol kinase
MALIMAFTARVLSPAKVNLHLEIYPRRDDGFHSLLSVFQMIDMYDELVVRSLTDDDVCNIEGDFDFPAEENIISRCCRIFRKKTGIRTGLAFSVRKRIPQGAGLGGGSSNGAAALRALNAMFAAGFSAAELAAMGAEAGSDIPFFCKAPAALVAGRGEAAEELAPRTDYSLVLVIPPLRINTAAAYGWLDAANAAALPAPGREDYIRSLYKREALENWIFFNSFFPVLAKKYPVFAEIRGRLREAGALYANVSGSGSAMFGIFRSETDALKAKKSMEKDFCTESAAPLAGMPGVILQ